MNLQKEKNFRSKKMLDLCRGQSCMLDIDGVCNGDEETVVPCHSPDFNRMHGKSGIAVKASDNFTIPACSSCHDYLDNRSHTEISNDEKQERFDRASAKWIVSLFVNKKIKV